MCLASQNVQDPVTLLALISHSPESPEKHVLIEVLPRSDWSVDLSMGQCLDC